MHQWARAYVPLETVPSYGTFTVAWPANEIEMLPSQVHSNFEELFNAGLFLTMTVAQPGIHGDAVAGMQGAGVGTPSAAEVVAITAGFVGALHIPNGMMFFIGMLSMIVAAGMLTRFTRFSGVTIMVLGATPKLHMSTAEFPTS